MIPTFTRTATSCRTMALALAAGPVLAVSVLAASWASAAEPVRQVLPGAQAAEPSQALTREAPQDAAHEAAPEKIATGAVAGDESEIQRFCSNIADAARDRRYALQAEELKQLQTQVEQRIKALEDKRAEYEQWLKRREVFLARAEDGVVKIYAGMKPDAAAERLAMVNVDLAAAILMKIDPRKAGVILNEMDQKAAATLTAIMASAARRTDPS